jgi:hypothetical protein
LIGMVAVCAQGENRFGQSVREKETWELKYRDETNARP